MAWLKTLFLSRKTLMALAFIGAIFSVGWYVNGIINENRRLETKVTELTVNNQMVTQTLKDQESEFEKTIAGYDAAMSHYINAVFESDELNQQLEYKLENISDETLRMCMGTGVTAEFLDSVFNYPTNHNIRNSN